MTDIVFWHGWGMNPQVWDDFIPHLKAVLPPSYQFHNQALPGYGETSLPPLSYSAEKVIESLLSELPASFVLCAWSMGALLAMQAAHQYSERVKSLILIGSSPSFMQRPDWGYGMQEQAMQEFTESVRSDSGTALKRFIALFNQNDVNARQIGRTLAKVKPASLLTLEQGLGLLEEIDCRPIVSRISQPALLIHGKHDPLMPLGAAQWLAKTMPHAKLAVLPNAAHAPFLSDSIQCAELMSHFLHDEY